VGHGGGIRHYHRFLDYRRVDRLVMAMTARAMRTSPISAFGAAGFKRGFRAPQL
jgi:hypothetical protein